MPTVTFFSETLFDKTCSAQILFPGGGIVTITQSITFPWIFDPTDYRRGSDELNATYLFNCGGCDYEFSVFNYLGTSSTWGTSSNWYPPVRTTTTTTTSTSTTTSTTTLSPTTTTSTSTSTTTITSTTTTLTTSTTTTLTTSTTTNSENIIFSGRPSENPSFPTQLVLITGTCIVNSQVGPGTNNYFTFNVDIGQSISSIRLLSYVSTDNVAWIGLQNGTSWTAGDNPSMMITNQHFGTSEIGQNLLTDSYPITFGDYTIRVQQLGAITYYTLEIIYTNEVPTTSTTTILPTTTTTTTSTTTILPTTTTTTTSTTTILPTTTTSTTTLAPTTTTSTTTVPVFTLYMKLNV